ncbi:hypothetical protein B0H13DRAFT_2678258 [Mycena leptocephala]|nr:hypothetical protein B0H13DRAFT_2678258 [Mycena leptocephala]
MAASTLPYSLLPVPFYFSLMEIQILVHLVYIHGFQGNDTSFQTFPTDLQEHLSAIIPSYLNIKSSIYPTYKSRKHIALATQNFLAWLSTQPPGPVILLSHSMGGLLAADAATDASNSGPPTSRRILGVVAFDVPYLGMHPHVVISGIASLFPDDDGDKRTAGDMNQHSDVQIVDNQVTDDWDGFKRNLDANSSSHSLRFRTHSPAPPPAAAESSALTPTAQQPKPFGLPASPFVDKTLSFLSAHSNDPLVRWVRKHSDEPFSAAKRFVVEYFQFGSYGNNQPDGVLCHGGDVALLGLILFGAVYDVGFYCHLAICVHPRVATEPASSDPKAVAKAAKAEEKERRALEKAREKELKKIQKQRAKEEKDTKARSKGKPGHHFIVLPTGLGKILGGGEKWEKVVIGGVEDEVQAHCGLFIRGQNLDYDGLVERVGQRVLGWCETFR